ncbi:MAG TPA: hypothetical protein VKT78_11060 [Fimbriimonadaceae bacterium]|nr:hypothetical protein [Fimbriimonadaceae bacterium]
MDIRDALKGQYHAGLRMLRECVELCPEEMWLAGAPREYWRIAYHAVFFTHLYMGQNEAAFKPWHKHQAAAYDLWGEDELTFEPYTKADVIGYIDDVREMVNPTVDALDLDTDDPGFHWYKNINKLEHELLNLRHIQGHVGQLSERLMAQGIDSSWISRRA